MSIPLASIGAGRPGSVVQLGYIVANIDDGVAAWLDRGAGPFFRTRFDLAGQLFRGAPIEAEIEVAVGYQGDMMIELIQPLGEANSIYSEFARTRSVGLHHVMLATVDMDESLTRDAARSAAIIASGNIPGFGRAAFSDTLATLGHYVEYGEWSPSVLAAIAGFRRAHLGWDGRDPVRPYPTVA